MEIGFSKEEELLQWAVKDFADRELAPKEILQFDESFKGIIKKLGELGFLGLKLPEKYGGDPASWVMFGILLEEIARVNASVAHFLLTTHQVAASIEKYGSDGVRDEWLRSLVNGGKIGCTAVTEPEMGSDFAAIRCEAIGDGDHYVLSGVKSHVSFGAIADVCLVFARTGMDGKRGISALLVPLEGSGVNRMPIDTVGLAASASARLTFASASIPAAYRLADEGQGFSVCAGTSLMSAVNQIGSALICLGVAQAASKLAVRYSKERYAFGKPLAKFEAVSNRLSEDMTMLEAGRWLCYRALWLQDRGLANEKEAAMCGWWCPKVSSQAIQNALLVHGHAGYCDDHPFERMLKDVLGFETIAGTEGILKLIIGCESIGSVAMPEAVIESIGR
jgi:cyclohexanecarboxyl-CoA dehydrogenase